MNLTIMYPLALFLKTIRTNDENFHFSNLKNENQSCHKLNVKMNVVCHCQTYEIFYFDIILLVIII